MGRGGAAAVVAAVILALCSSAGHGAPVQRIPLLPSNIMRHQNIVMTLHGLLEHIDVVSWEASVAPASARALAEYVDQQFAANEPAHVSLADLRWQTKDQRDVALGRLLSFLDLDNNAAIFLPELAGWLLAVAGHFQAQARHAARLEFVGIVGSADGTLSRRYVPAEFHTEVTEQAFRDADVDRSTTLDAEEWFYFRYPQFCPVVRSRFATDFLAATDLDGDGALNLTEFTQREHVIKAPGDNKYSAQAFDFRAEEQELRRVFRSELDRDGNTLLDAHELALLLDPLHHFHAVAEAYRLVAESDDNGDHELSLAELLKHGEKYVASRMFNFSERSHAEVLEQYKHLLAQMARQLHPHDEL